LKKELVCSDMPQLVNIIETFTGENYVLVAFKNKCELICEKTGDLLRQYTFSTLATIRSIAEVYDNNKLEFLITHNCK
jgi:hypothetical protein